MNLPPITLFADKPAPGGSVVGRADGRVVFCRHGLPGETIRALPDPGAMDTNRFWRAEALEVLDSPSPHRRESPCPWFGPGACGGCDWLHADPQYQRELKAAVLVETLQRIGGVTWTGTVGDLGLETGWRTRATLHADATGRVGLHAARSNTVVPIGSCLQMHPGMHIDQVLSDTWPPGSSVHVSLSEAGRAVLVEGRLVEGSSEHVHTVGERQYTRAVGGFWQSHVLAAEFLLQRVRALVDTPEDASIVDLYAGVGLFGLGLADLVPDGRIMLVEGDRAAARHARRNAEGDARVRVVAVDVRRWRPSRADLVVLDPPRAGAGEPVVRAVVASGPSQVLYVSCEPATLARDLALFARQGYRPDHIEAWDLFPGTSHVETVVRLVPAAV